MMKSIDNAIKILEKLQSENSAAKPPASNSASAATPVTVTANVSHTNPLYPNAAGTGNFSQTNSQFTGEPNPSNSASAANGYTYDPNSNAAYLEAIGALSEMQGNKPAGSYDPNANQAYLDASEAFRQAFENKPAAYDPVSDAAYQEALAALQQAQANTPTYAGTYDAQLQNLYNSIVNREKFSYDLNSDMLYQQYRDQYKMMGQQAMMDTMGQAASLTGGYGSSYAQQVGQQSYNNYLNQLNNVVPDLYGMALDQYNAEGQNLLNQYSMLGDLRNNEYSAYRDSLTDYWNNIQYLADRANTAYNQGYTAWNDANEDYWNNLQYLRDLAETEYDRGYTEWSNAYNDYWQNLDYLTGRADTEYDRGYGEWINATQMQNAAEQKEYDRLQDAWEKEKYEDETAYNREQDAWEKEKYEDEAAYNRTQDAYDKLRDAIVNSGYKPTAEELIASGMGADEAEYWLGVYNYSREQDVKEDERYKEELAWEREQIDIDRKNEADKTAYERQQDAYSNLVTAIASTGYTPTAEELTAAGMSQAEAEAWLNYFNLQNGTSYSYVSSGGSGGSGYYSGSGSSSGGSSSGGSSSGSGSSGSSGSSVANTVIGTTAFAPDGIQVGSNPADIQYIDYDYLASQGNKNNTSSGASKNNTSSGASKTKTSNKTSNSSSSSSGNKQTQAGSTSTTTNSKSGTLSTNKMASTIAAYKSQITSQYGSNISTAKMNAYLKNKILYSGYSSAQKTQLLKYAGLM